MILDPIRVIVDFAHTPVSLEHSLSALREVLPKNKRIITVFGCAGKRDKGRRRMGNVSARLSDITVLTAEDPRNEPVAQINTEIYNTARSEKAHIIFRFTNHDDYALTSLGEIHAELEGTWKGDQKPFILFDENARRNRADAIELAIRLAREGDCVFITGKGHEQSLSFGAQEKEFAWSDQDEVTAVLEKLQITK
jgi:UDP-N-acetylmuramoyl-L-alanyl-D-glutamate--2,6-diaminopimelate ligase